MDSSERDADQLDEPDHEEFFLSSFEEETLSDFSSLPAVRNGTEAHGMGERMQEILSSRKQRYLILYALLFACVILLCFFGLVFSFVGLYNLIGFLWPSRVSHHERPQPSKPGYVPLVFVSLDGFALKYYEDEASPIPNLRALAAGGVSSPMRPVYPTKTFPNHYSMATGLYPESHGIVENHFYDPVSNSYFSLAESVLLQPHWWLGQPIWNVLESARVSTAAVAFPGTATFISGHRPSHVDPFAHKSAREVTTQGLEFLDAYAPRLLLLYMNEVDNAGHAYGPGTPEVAEAMRQVDEAVGLLVEGLQRRFGKRGFNLVVVSDHGMAALDPERLQLDRVLNASTLASFTAATTFPLLAVRPHAEVDVGKLATELQVQLAGNASYISIYLKEMLPAEYHYVNSPRIMPIIGLCQEGKQAVIGTPPWQERGDHGYDNKLYSMQAIFIASGPAFRVNTKLDSYVRTLDLFELIGHVTGVALPPNNGSLSEISRVFLEKPFFEKRK